MESFRGGALHIDSRDLRIYAKSIHSFSLGRCQGWLSKRLDEGSCSFCSIHSFLCNCGDRMERLDRNLTSEGCNTFSMAKTSGKAQCAPYYKNAITYSTSLLYITIVSPFLHNNFMWRLPIPRDAPWRISILISIIIQCYYNYYCYYFYYFYFYYSYYHYRYCYYYYYYYY